MAVSSDRVNGIINRIAYTHVKVCKMDTTFIQWNNIMPHEFNKKLFLHPEEEGTAKQDDAKRATLITRLYE